MAATGFRPDLEMLREVRLDLDPALEAPAALAPLVDPELHSCGTVPPHGEPQLAHPEPGFYLAGMKSYGRAPTFLLTTGYEQVRSIVAALAGDRAAADAVPGDLATADACGAVPGDLATTDAGDPAPPVEVVAAAGSCCGPAGCG